MKPFNYATEFKKLARGKRTVISAQEIAKGLLTTVELGMREWAKRDDILELNRIFELKDPRG